MKYRKFIISVILQYVTFIQESKNRNLKKKWIFCRDNELIKRAKYEKLHLKM